MSLPKSESWPSEDERVLGPKPKKLLFRAFFSSWFGIANPEALLPHAAMSEMTWPSLGPEIILGWELIVSAK